MLFNDNDIDNNQIDNVYRKLIKNVNNVKAFSFKKYVYKNVKTIF